MSLLEVVGFALLATLIYEMVCSTAFLVVFLAPAPRVSAFLYFPEMILLRREMVSATLRKNRNSSPRRKKIIVWLARKYRLA